MTIQELYTDPAHHCRGHYAVDANKRAVPIESAEAVAWCLSGALCKCYSDCGPQYYGARQKLTAQLVKIGECDIADFNDTASFEWILEVVKRADV